MPPNALPQVFLKPPRNPESLKAAHEWAQANNIAILPTAACTEEPARHRRRSQRSGRLAHYQPN
ncbi:MAG: hypothetical protein M5U34_40665 [Chloroflexi bacterium]|nr:hypothetical protein [Chloroflexota bacterium]